MNTQFFINRRDFVRAVTISSAVTTMTAKSYSQIVGANERVNIGILGFGLIGRIYARSFSGLKEARSVAVSDTFKPRMDACKEIAADVKTHADFRKLIESKDVDASVPRPAGATIQIEVFIISAGSGTPWAAELKGLLA